VFVSIWDAFQTRLILYQNSLDLLGDYPLTGVGLGDAFARVYSRYQLLILPPFLFYAHNLFLSVALNFGILGLVALGWLLFDFCRFVIKVERVGQVNLIYFRAVYLGATAIFVHGLIDSPHFSNSHWTMPMLFAILGLVSMLGYPHLRQNDRPDENGLLWSINNNRRPQAGPWYQDSKWKTGAAVAAFLIILGAVFYRPLMAAWYTNLGTIFQTQADLSSMDHFARDELTDKAVAYFEQSLRLQPAQPSVELRLGLIALDRQEFDTALTHLERAYRQEPTNQTIIKALGLTYKWTGKPELADQFLSQLNPASGITAEPGVWNY